MPQGEHYKRRSMLKDVLFIVSRDIKIEPITVSVVSTVLDVATKTPCETEPFTE